MKTLVLWLLTASLALAFIACGDDETASPAPATPTLTATTATGTATATVTPADTATPTPTGTSAPTGTAAPTVTATATETATPTATETATTTTTPDETTATVAPTQDGSREELIGRFPPEAQDLLQNVPDNLIELLWRVREQGPSDLVWADYGGEAYEGRYRAALQDWETITGWTIVQTAADAAAFEAQVTAGNVEMDLFEIGDYGTAVQMEQKDLFAPLDLSYFPVARFPESSLYSDYWINPYDYDWSLIWNTEVYEGPEPTSILDVFNTEQFPGKRCLYNVYPPFDGNFEFALMADGVPPEEVYELLATEEGVERALAKLDAIKDDVVWTSSGADSVQFVLDGQCELGIAWSGRPALRLLDEPDLPLKAVKKDTLISGSPFGLPRGGENVEAATSALAYWLQPDNVCENLNIGAYGMIMDDPVFPDCLNDFGRTWSVDPEQAALVSSGEFYAEHVGALAERWAAWITGG